MGKGSAYKLTRIRIRGFHIESRLEAVLDPRTVSQVKHRGFLSEERSETDHSQSDSTKTSAPSQTAASLAALAPITDPYRVSTVILSVELGNSAPR